MRAEEDVKNRMGAVLTVFTCFHYMCVYKRFILNSWMYVLKVFKDIFKQFSVQYFLDNRQEHSCTVSVITHFFQCSDTRQIECY